MLSAGLFGIRWGCQAGIHEPLPHSLPRFHANKKFRSLIIVISPSEGLGRQPAPQVTDMNFCRQFSNAGWYGKFVESCIKPGLNRPPKPGDESVFQVGT